MFSALHVLFKLQNNEMPVYEFFPHIFLSIFKVKMCATWGLVYNSFTLLLGGDCTKDKSETFLHKYLDMGLSLPGSSIQWIVL